MSICQGKIKRSDLKMSSNDYLEEPPKPAANPLCKADMIFCSFVFCVVELCIFCVVELHTTSTMGGLPTQESYLIYDGLCMRCYFDIFVECITWV